MIDTDVGWIEVGGRRVRITHPDRVLWPATGTTKRQLIEYDLAIAPVLLPHLRGRGLTLGRWPEGVDRPGWLQAECRGRPDWVRVHEVRSRNGGAFGYCIADDAATLAWLANLGTIELHPFLAPAATPRQPSFLVFDLDPGPGTGLAACARVALRIRERLADVDLAAWPKTSGMLGLHLFAPLAPGHDFATTKAFARSVAGDLAADDPDGVTDRMARHERAGRVYVDWVQNDASRSTVAAYSPRAAPIPLVSMPLRWDEVEALARDPAALPPRFGFREAIERVARLGDLFEPVLRGTGRLPHPTDRPR